MLQALPILAYGESFVGNSGCAPTTVLAASGAARRAQEPVSKRCAPDRDHIPDMRIGMRGLANIDVVR